MRITRMYEINIMAAEFELTITTGQCRNWGNEKIGAKYNVGLDQ